MVERVLFAPGGATEAKQDDLLVAIEALETITATISNWPSDYPDATVAVLLTAIKNAVQGTLSVDVVSGVVGLDSSTLSALETINATVSGEVSLDSSTIAALQSISAVVSNFPNNYPDAGALLVLNQILTALGTVSVVGPLTDLELRAADVDVADSGEREYTHVVATVTSAGDTIVHTPASGKSIRLHWIYAINDPTSSNSPLINVKIGVSALYRVYALSKRQRKTGAVDAPLIINLSDAGSVAVTAILEEV